MTIDIITTDRLVLRSVGDADPGQLYDLVFSDPEVMLHAFKGGTLSEENAADFFNNTFDHDGNGKQLGVLTLRNSGNIIGFSGLLECSILGCSIPGKPDYEIGFVLGREFWGRGYATEIGIAQIEYGFDLAGCDRLLGVVTSKNEASRSALIKIGMSHHSTVETEQRGLREVYMAQCDSWHKP
jgi:ribosomal-protein-alanine N-acetyltransferase